MPTYATPIAPVAAPTRTARPYGLGSVFGWRTGDRWEAGVTWSSLPCLPALGRSGATCLVDQSDTIPGLPKPIEAAGGPAIGEATPFIVLGLYRCLTIGNTIAEAQEWADAALLAGEETRAEKALWFGDLGNIPNLSGANGYPAPTSVGNFADPVEALARVEQALAANIGSGVIHMSPAMATRLAKYLEPRGGRQYTRGMGTPVVVGAGYPDGAVVATAPLFGYRGEIFNSSSRPGDLVDRAYNWMNAIAERTFLVGFDPCPVYKATVTIPAPTTQNPPVEPGTDLVINLGSIPASPIPDGSDATIIAQTNQAPTAEVILWYAVNGGAAVEAGEMTQVDAQEFVWNVQGDATGPGDSVELWAISEFDGDDVESNHIVIEVT